MTNSRASSIPNSNNHSGPLFLLCPGTDPQAWLRKTFLQCWNYSNFPMASGGFFPGPRRLGKLSRYTVWPREECQSIGWQKSAQCTLSSCSCLVPGTSMVVQGFLVATPTPVQADLSLNLLQSTPANPQDHTTNPHPFLARASSSHSIISGEGKEQ